MAKRALIIGVADIRPRSGLQPRPSVAAIESLLEDLGGWICTRLEGMTATREAILAALEQFATQVAADDDVLVYFFGHGGVVRFEGPTPLCQRPFFYIAAARPNAEPGLTGVFDFELSSIFAAIDRTCANVSVILDCCHAANIVRSGISRIPPPQWVINLIPSINPVDELLANEGHPRIVRLAGTSSLRSGFARKGPDGHLGLLTQGFVNVVREAGLELDRLSWDTVAHRVRQHAIHARHSEIQWVTLAGPRARLVCSRERIELPRSVGFVGGDEPGSGWLRAGRLQGVEAGELWDVCALRLSQDHQPEVLTRARVVDVGLNRSRVQLLDGSATPADGSSALLVRARSLAPVVVDDGAPLAEMFEKSALIRRADASETNVFARVSMAERALEVSRSPAGPDSLTMRVDGPIEARVLLEDWARADRLERLTTVGPSNTAVDAPLTLSWGRYSPVVGSRAVVRHPLALDGTAVVHAGDRLYFEIAHRQAHPESWFVCVVEIGAAGRPILVTTNEPDGVEVGRQQPVDIGCRSAGGRKGLQVGWPVGLSKDRPRVVTMLYLASQRPIPLGHLVRISDRNAHLLQVLPREVPNRTRGHANRALDRAPELTQKWGLQVLRYTLKPEART